MILKTSDRTAGGLILIPHIEFKNSEDLVDQNGNEPMVTRGDPRGDDWDEYHNPDWEDPLSDGDFEDSLFDWPFKLSVHAFDIHTDLEYKASLQRYIPKFQRINELIGIDNKRSSLITYSATLGASTNNNLASKELKDEGVGDILTSLCSVAGKRLLEGDVSRDDLHTLVSRDIGRYKGNEIFNMGVQGTAEFDYIGKDLVNAIADQFIDQHTREEKGDDTLNIQDMYRDAMRVMKPSFEEAELTAPVNSEYASNDEGRYSYAHELTGKVFIPTLIHSIGARNFLPAYLDAYKTKNSEGVDAFLGGKSQVKPNAMKLLLRALPPESMHYKMLIKNHYKKSC